MADGLIEAEQRARIEAAELTGIKSITFALLSSVLLSHSLALAAAEWVVIPEESHIAFHGSMLGVPAVGYFRQFLGNITFDPDDLENAHVMIDVDMASVDSAHDERDTALRLPEWFSAGVFPRARFEAGEFRRTGEATFEALGTLTIKGITREITLPFALTIDDGTASVSGQLNLSRQDFNIGTGEWENDQLVAFDVLVEYSIVARPAPSP